MRCEDEQEGDAKGEDEHDGWKKVLAGGASDPVSGASMIIHADALAWMAATPAEPGTSVITSLPDVSELPLPLDAWRAWFVDAARRVVRWVPEDGLAIFFQSDIREKNVLVDKGYLVMRAAEAENAKLMFHKVAWRKPPGRNAFGRPTYSHLVAVTRGEARAPVHPGPDVFDAGAMSWSRAMGLEACAVACRYLRDNTSTRIVVDPFCGRGGVLSVACNMGFDVIGVDLSAKRCRATRKVMSAGAPG